jgi:hypothetical protein
LFGVRKTDRWRGHSKTMADIFISYVHEDHEIAKSLASFLREPECCNPPLGASVPPATYSVFFTGDDWLLYAGEIWLQRIREELTAAKVLLSLFSPYSVERSWVHFEAGAAWLSNKGGHYGLRRWSSREGFTDTLLGHSGRYAHR